jgi:hypothetical protein
MSIIISVCAGAETQTFRLIDSPIPVTAKLENNDPDRRQVLFQVGEGPLVSEVHSFVPMRNWPAASQELRGHVIWRPPFLFVLSDNGGNCWDCSGAAIFKVTGHAFRRIGDLNNDIRPAAGPPRIGDHFVTRYSRLEQEIGFCHGCAPSFLVSLDEHDGLLRVNEAATWSLNRKNWEKNDQMIRRVLTKIIPDPKSEDQLFWKRETALSALISNAALAKYCGRSHALQDLLAVAEPSLDNHARKRLDDALAIVVPSELPSAWNSHSPY